MKNALKLLLAELKPKKDVRRVMAESGTHTEWFPRVHSLPVKYVYGRSPEEFEEMLHRPLPDDLPDTQRMTYPLVPPETSSIPREDGDVVARVAEPRVHNDVWKLCRLLDNPCRFHLLKTLYRVCRNAREDGFSVTMLLDRSTLNQPSVSEYLKQLEALGLIRRARAGRSVNYYPDYSAASPEVREIASMMRQRLLDGSDNTTYTEVFPAMRNAFRAHVIHEIAGGADGSIDSLCERYQRKVSVLVRDLQPAVDAVLLNLTSEDPTGVYLYAPPLDPIGQRIVELAS